MKIIYHCYGGTHSSVLCAALHLGIITEQRLPSMENLINLPYFDKIPSTQVGNIFHMGRDEQGNNIYILGCRNCGPLVENTTREVQRIMGINRNEVILIDSKPALNYLIKIGGFLSRRIGLSAMGRFFLYRGIRLAYPNFINLVLHVKQDLAKQ